MNYYHIRSLKRILFLFAFLFPILLNAQSSLNYEAIKSEVFKDEYKGSTLVDVNGDGKGGIIAVRSLEGSFIAFPKGYVFEHFDNKMNIISKYIYENKKTYVLGSLVKNDSITIIEAEYDKKAKSYIYYGSVTSIHNFNFIRKKLFDLPCKQFFPYRTDIDGLAVPTIRMVKNPDNSAFAISIETRKIESISRIYVFDSNLKEKFRHDFNQGAWRWGYEDIDIAHNGEKVFMLFKDYNKETRKKEEGGQYEFHLYCINKETVEKKAFSVEEHFITDLNASIFNDKIICSGFYSDERDYKAIGICFFEFDSTLKLKNSKFNKFSEEFIFDKYGKQKDKETEYLKFKNLYKNDIGEYILCAEEFWRETISYSTGSGMGPSEPIYKYHFNDIVCAKLNNEGDLIWARNINKKQATKTDFSYLSCSFSITNNNTYIFINDSGSVNQLRKDRIEFTKATFSESSQLNIIKVTNDGDFNYVRLEDDDVKTPYMVRDSHSIDNSVYFLGGNGKQKRVLKITL